MGSNRSWFWSPTKRIGADAMNTIYSAFLGYDVRVSAGAAARVWEQQRREAFLLNPRTSTPLSVDESCWPSVFRYSKGGRETISDARAILVEPSDFRHSVFRLWPKLDEMIAATSQDVRGSVVAVQVFSIKPLMEVEFWRGALEGFEPRKPGFENWKFLGYDVADESRQSGLCNCQYSEAEFKKLRPEWQRRLNQAGLIPSMEDALEFRSLTDHRVPEHSPFYVYSVHQMAIDT